MSNPQPPTIVREIWPLLFVVDLDRSLAFYQEKLGFALADSAELDEKVYWCRLQRDACSVMLQQSTEEDGPPEGRGRGVVFYFICDDADQFHAELVAQGLPVAPPETAPYGMRQVHIADPDGYSLCFESVLSPIS